MFLELLFLQLLFLFLLQIIIIIEQLFELLEIFFKPIIKEKEEYSKNDINKKEDDDNDWNVEFELRLLNLICDEKEE